MMLNAVEAAWLFAQLVLVGGCAYVLWRGLFATLPPRKHARCGGCGYELNVIAGSKCPECGGEFLKVGIRRSGERRRMRGWLVACVLAWTLFAVWGMYFYAWGLIGTAFKAVGLEPVLWDVRSNGSLWCYQVDRGDITFLTVEQTDTTGGGSSVLVRENAARIELVFFLQGDEQVRKTLEADLRLSRLDGPGEFQWSGDKFTTDVVAEALIACGVPTDAVFRDAGPPEIAAALESLASGAALADVLPDSKVNSRSPVRPVIYLAANRHALAINGRTLLVVLIYLAGLVYIYRRWRSRVRTADAEAEAA